MPAASQCLSPEIYVELGGRVWCEPTTVVTDLLVVGLLLVLTARARRGLGRAYFALLAAAFLAGAARHLLQHEAPNLPGVLSRVQNVASSGALGLLGSVLLLGRDGRGQRRVALVWGGMAGVFGVAHLLWDHFALTVAHQAVAQLAAAGVVLARGQVHPYRWFLGSLGLGVLCAVVFAAPLAPHPWFNQNDLAHVLMLPAFGLMGRQLRALD